MGYKDENWIILVQKGDMRSTQFHFSVSTKGRKLKEQLSEHQLLNNVAHIS
jgi:hypothetical protein